MHTCSRHAEKKTLSKAGGTWEAEKYSFFWIAGAFNTSEEFSSLTLGLASLKEVRIVNWPTNVV